MFTSHQPLVAALFPIFVWLSDVSKPVLAQRSPNSAALPAPLNRSRNVTFFAPNSNSVALEPAIFVPVKLDNSHTDLCLNFPCKNNATCQPIVGGGSSALAASNSFKCLCQSGWTGRLCDVDIDECADSSNRCQNGAMCRNLPGSVQVRKSPF